MYRFDITATIAGRVIRFSTLAPSLQVAYQAYLSAISKREVARW